MDGQVMGGAAPKPEYCARRRSRPLPEAKSPRALSNLASKSPRQQPQSNVHALMHAPMGGRWKLRRKLPLHNPVTLSRYAS